jgi:hypothetical protein
MLTRDGNPQKAPSGQVLTAVVENDSEKKPDSASDGASMEKLGPQSMSYRRSRDVALMKLAFLRPENDEAP